MIFFVIFRTSTIYLSKTTIFHFFFFRFASKQSKNEEKLLNKQVNKMANKKKEKKKIRNHRARLPFHSIKLRQYNCTNNSSDEPTNRRTIEIQKWKTTKKNFVFLLLYSQLNSTSPFFIANNKWFLGAREFLVHKMHKTAAV